MKIIEKNQLKLVAGGLPGPLVTIAIYEIVTKDLKNKK